MNDRAWRAMLLDPAPPPRDPVRDAVDPAARHDERRRSPRLRDRGGRVYLNLTPMIDVTFLLLVFFVCTTRSLEAEHVFRVDVPPMEAKAAIDEPTTGHAIELREPPLRVRVATRPEGAVVTLEPKFAEVDSIASLERVMRESRRGEAAGTRAAKGLFAADHPILIDPDRDCAWDDIVAALNALLRAGYRQIGFAGARDAPSEAGP